MKPLDLLLVLPLAGPAFGTLNFSNWAPPGPNDFRAPCPAMNSLANHHFINHDGTNITVKELVPIMNQVFNISTELGTIVSSLGLLTADDPASGVFTLNDLNKHNIFEHDASLSRCDFNICGDNHSFNQTIFNEFLSFFNGSEYVTIERAAAARYHLVQKSRAQNPQFTYDVHKQITSYGETIKYFRTMVDPTTKLTSLNFVKILFGRFSHNLLHSECCFLGYCES
jgi:hypothetical protein